MSKLFKPIFVALALVVAFLAMTYVAPAKAQPQTTTCIAVDGVKAGVATSDEKVTTFRCSNRGTQEPSFKVIPQDEYVFKGCKTIILETVEGRKQFALNQPKNCKIVRVEKSDCGRKDPRLPSEQGMYSRPPVNRTCGP